MGQDVNQDVGHLAYHKGLLGILKGEGEKEATEGGMAHVRSVKSGIRGLEGSIKSSLGSGHADTKGIDHKGRREALKSKLEGIDENPEQLLDVGSHLGDMPDQAGVLAAHAATAVQYLGAIKPKPVQPAPLDKPVQPSRVMEANYNRQLDIANHPGMVLSSIGNGSLQPNDITTLRTLYPGLYSSMQNKVMEQLISSEAAKEPISYKKRQSLSMFLEQPLNFTDTPTAAQAIIKSQAQVAQNRVMGPPNGVKKPTGAQLKAISKSDDMYATDSQKREINAK